MSRSSFGRGLPPIGRLLDRLHADKTQESWGETRSRSTTPVPLQESGPTHYVHLPQLGSFLSHFFFFRRQLRQTLEDLAPPSDDGDGASEAGGFSEFGLLCIVVVGASYRTTDRDDQRI